MLFLRLGTYTSAWKIILFMRGFVEINTKKHLGHIVVYSFIPPISFIGGGLGAGPVRGYV